MIKKTIKILVALITVTVALLSLTGCLGSGIDVAYVTDGERLDDNSSNEAIYEGVVRYGEEQGRRYKYFEPEGTTEEAYAAAISAALNKNPRTVVINGAKYEAATYNAALNNPKTKFILIEGTAHAEDGSDTAVPANVKNIYYSEHELGFIAGYSVVKEGMRRLGFIGDMDYTDTVSYGYGFIQGAEYAALESGLQTGSVDIKYYYTKADDKADDITAISSEWFSKGTELIFPCSSQFADEVIATAEANNRKVITVDKDYAPISMNTISCLQKSYSDTVYNNLKEIYDKSWSGGRTVRYSVADGALTLKVQTSRFTVFTVSQLNTILSSVSAGRFTIYSRESDTGGSGNPMLLRTTYATVEYIEE